MVTIRVPLCMHRSVQGSSGAGKSTLLDLISARRNEGAMSGSVCFNGEPLSANIKKRSAYVQQTDLHLARLTVRRCYCTDTSCCEYRSLCWTECLQFCASCTYGLAREVQMLTGTMPVRENSRWYCCLPLMARPECVHALMIDFKLLPYRMIISGTRDAAVCSSAAHAREYNTIRETSKSSSSHCYAWSA
jgi:ABC transporter